MIPKKPPGTGPERPRRQSGTFRKVGDAPPVTLEGRETERRKTPTVPAQPKPASPEGAQTSRHSRRTSSKPGVPSHYAVKREVYGEDDYWLQSRKPERRHSHKDQKVPIEYKECEEIRSPSKTTDSKFLAKVKSIPFAAELFSLIDAVNQDGQIDRCEWTKFQRIVEQEALDLYLMMCSGSDVFDDVDADHNNSIDLFEWSEYVEAVIEILGEREWKATAERIATALSARDLRRNEEVHAVGHVQHHLHKLAKMPTCERELFSNPMEYLAEEKHVRDSCWLRPDEKKHVSFSLGEVALLEQYFALRDLDSSGCLNVEELMYVINDLGRTPKNDKDAKSLEKLRLKADEDGNGTLTFNEFLGFLAAYYQKVYKRVFGAYDFDDSGAIDMHEIKNVLVQLRKAGFEVDWVRVEELIRTVDVNGDGHLTFDEFCELMAAYRNVEFEQLKTYSGFPISKVVGMRQVFESYDDDDSNCLELGEVAFLMERLFSDKKIESMLDLQVVGGLYLRMDQDLSGGLCFEEFLRFIRVWAGGGLYPKKEDVCALSQEPFGKAIRESIIEGWAEDVLLIIEDKRLARQTGMPLADISAIRGISEFCLMSSHAEKEGDIRIVKCMQLLGERMGSNSDPDRILLSQVCSGLDMEGGIDFPQVLWIINHYYEALAMVAVPAEGIPRNQTLNAFFKIGHYYKPENCEAMLAAQGLDEHQEIVSRDCFLKMLLLRRDQALEQWRESLGFQEARLEHYRHTFYDPRFSGSRKAGDEDSSRRGLDDIKLILESLGYILESREHRQPIFRSVLRCVGDIYSQQTVDFKGLLRIMRLLDNHQARHRSHEVRQVLVESGLELDLAAVQTWQALFYKKDADHDDKLLKREVVHLILEVVGHNDVTILCRHKQKYDQIKEIVSRGAGDDHIITFKEMMLIIKNLEDLDIKIINPPKDFWQ